jgi:hypothetical protein
VRRSPHCGERRVPPNPTIPIEGHDIKRKQEEHPTGSTVRGSVEREVTDFILSPRDSLTTTIRLQQVITIEAFEPTD